MLQGVVWPVELTGDEAFYWDWSRHPALSYQTKGPGVAWAITLGTRLCGTTELGVRLFAYCASGVGVFAAGWLGALCASSRGWDAADQRRAAFGGAVAFASLAAFQVAGSVMTTDGPMLSCWTLATAAVVSARGRACAGRVGGATRHLMLAGVAVGVGFLFKYTIALALLGLVVAVWRDRVLFRNARLGCVAALVLACAGILPVLVWNAQNGWVALHHLLGHVGLPEDRENASPWYATEWWWVLECVALFAVLPGPFLAAEFGRGVRLAWRDRRPGDGIAMWASLPVVGLYVLVALRTRVEANWLLGAYCGLVGFVGLLFADPKLVAGPSWFRRGFLVRGVATMAVLLLAQPLLSTVEATGWSRLTRRVQGNAEFARAVAHLLAAEGLDSRFTPVVCNYYDRCGILAFYLPSHPIVRCASYALSQRRSAYDSFEGARFPDEALVGSEIVLLGASSTGGSVRWTSHRSARSGPCSNGGVVGACSSLFLHPHRSPRTINADGVLVSVANRVRSCRSAVVDEFLRLRFAPIPLVFWLATWAAFVCALCCDGLILDNLEPAGERLNDFHMMFRVFGTAPFWLVATAVVWLATVGLPQAAVTRGHMVVATFTGALSAGVAALLKPLVRRPDMADEGPYRGWAWQPLGDEPWDATDLCFPSEHAAMSWGACVALGRAYPRAAPLFVLVGFGTAAARVKARGHHPSDVAASLLVALAVSCAISKVQCRLQARRCVGWPGSSGADADEARVLRSE